MLHAELFIFYLVGLIMTASLYLKMYETVTILFFHGSGEGEKPPAWPKDSGGKLTALYILLGLCILEFVAISALLAYCLYCLVVDFRSRPEACKEWCEAGHAKFTQYTRELFGDNMCLICQREFLDQDELV